MIRIGDSGEFSKTITESDVYTFAGVSGDFNRIHIDAEAAKDTVFKERIAHGFLVGSLISTVIGTKMPGEGAIYLKQSMSFCKPVFIGDTCKAIVTVDEIINESKGIYRLTTKVFNQNKDEVIDGYAIIKYTSKGDN